MRDAMRGWFDRHPRTRVVFLVALILLSLPLVPLAFTRGEPVGGVLLLLGLPAAVYSLVKLLRSDSLSYDD